DAQYNAVILVAGKQVRRLNSIKSKIDRVSFFAQATGDRARQLWMIFSNKQSHGFGPVSIDAVESRNGDNCKSPRHSFSSITRLEPSTRTAFIFLRLCQP